MAQHDGTATDTSSLSLAALVRRVPDEAAQQSALDVLAQFAGTPVVRALETLLLARVDGSVEALLTASGAEIERHRGVISVTRELLTHIDTARAKARRK